MPTLFMLPQTVGDLKEIHHFCGPMPTGGTVSSNGRIFVNFPRWGDEVPFTVAEIKGGKEVPYPQGLRTATS